MSIILLFAFLVFLFVPYFFLIKEYGLDIQEYQWYFFIPMLTFYSVYNLWERTKIKARERIAPLKRPILHWILLGLTLIIFQINSFENHLEKIEALYFAFAVFTLFLADSYWDFAKISIFSKK